MASFFDQIKVKTAVDKYTKQTFLNRHQTTANFMEFGFAHCVELCPKQPYKVKHSAFVRLEPMPIPTNGNIKLNNRAFFVPYRTVWPVFNDFYNDVKSVTSSGSPLAISTAPTFTDNTLIDIFDDADFSVTAASDVVADFVIVGTDGTQSRRIFTEKGKRFYKILRQLGYSIDFNQNNSTFTHCALKLLCAAKISYDWYSVSSYQMDSRYTRVMAIFERRESYSLTKVDILDLFTILQWVNYDSDYFVSAWDNPIAPNDFSASSVTIQDIGNGNEQVYQRQVMFYGSTDGGNGAGNAPVLVGRNASGSSAALGAVSQYALTALKSLTDWMRRHQLAGARTLDRYLAQWGVKLEASKLDRSLYIGHKSESVLVGDVTSTSDTEGANLGAFAGKGVGYNEYTFDYNNDDEFGMFFIVSTIIPDVSYYQGETRDNMRISRLDFYQPEFDNLGVQAISKRELFCPLDGNLTSGINSWNNQVFGFIPRYADYKVQLDKVTGDYVVPHLATGKDSWYIGRDVSRFVDLTAPTPIDSLNHNIFFVEGSDADQYNRIFYNTDSSVDHFNVSHVFDIVTTFPGKSLYDTYEFDNNGHIVNLDVNGTKVN